MQNKFILAIIILFTSQISFAQLGFLGFKVEGSVMIPNFSNDVKVNKSLAKSVGLVAHYPINPKTEIVSDILYSAYKISSDIRSFDISNSKWTNLGSKTFKVRSIDLSGGLQRGFGDGQHFKVGFGAFFHLFLNNTETLPTLQYLGTNDDVEKNYNESFLYSKPNYGFLLEGIYNINDAFHISLRYKQGLSNIYKQPLAIVPSSSTWNQSHLGVGVIYYLGSEDRGKIIPKKTNKTKPKTKSRVNF